MPDTITNPIPKTDVLKRLWIGKCAISEFKQVTDPITHQTSSRPVVVVEDEPCRLSYSKEQVTNVQNGIPSVSQIITLFISPEIEVKTSSVISITQHGVTSKYKRSGKPMVYTNHQEIILQLDEVP